MTRKIRRLARPSLWGAALDGADESFYAARLMEHLAIPAFVLDASGRVLIWNLACERLTGCAAKDLIGTKDHWKAFYDSKRPCLADLVVENRLAEAESLYDAWSNTELHPHGLSAENWCAMPRTGEQLYLAIDVGPIFDEHGRLVAVVETLRNMTARKRIEAELVALAGCDPLTSIANRRTFEKRLAEEWTRAHLSRAPASLLLIDVDTFKLCNDNLGHGAGDHCLRQVADVIRNETQRANEIAARIGGDEFGVILPNAPLETGLAAAERIRNAVLKARLPLSRPPGESIVTVSIGVACSHDFPTRETFVVAADAALYEAKCGGRNRTVAHRFPSAPERRLASA